MKIKIAVKAIFCRFSTFFTEGKVAFTHTTFHGQSKVFKDNFLDFSTAGFSFSREANSEFLKIFTEVLFFYIAKKGQPHQISWKQLFLFFTHTRFNFHVCDLKEISLTQSVFSREVFKIYSREEKKIHGWKRKNWRKFSRKRF